MGEVLMDQKDVSLLRSNLHHHPPIFLATHVVVFFDREIVLAESQGEELPPGYALLDEQIVNRIGALLGKPLVDWFLAQITSMAFDEEFELGLAFHRGGDFENLLARRSIGEFGLAELEKNVLEVLGAAGNDGDRNFVSWFRRSTVIVRIGGGFLRNSISALVFDTTIISGQTTGGGAGRLALLRPSPGAFRFVKAGENFRGGFDAFGFLGGCGAENGEPCQEVCEKCLSCHCVILFENRNPGQRFSLGCISMRDPSFLCLPQSGKFALVGVVKGSLTTIPVLIQLLVVGLAPGQAHAEQHALLIAISEYSAEEFAPDLPACRQDAQIMKSWLTDEFAFPVANIAELYDREATTPRIREELERLVAEVEPGDSVVLYFSGHGGQVADYDGDETGDGLDEVLITYDFAQNIVTERRDPEAWLTDDVIRHYLTRLRTNRVLVLFDCCHAGTATRNWLGPYGFPRGAELKWFNTGFNWTRRPRAGMGATATLHHSDNANHVYIAACKATEQAIALAEGSLLTQSWTGNTSGQGSTPLSDLGQRIGAEVSVQAQRIGRDYDWITSSQTPQFEGNLGWTLNDLLSQDVSAAAKSLAFEDPHVAEEATDELREHPEKWGEIDVTVKTDQAMYEEGDPLTITVTSERDGYLQLFLIDAEGNQQFLFPHDQPGGAPIQANQPFAVTGPDAQRDFEMAEPFGHEMIKAMISTSPFPSESSEDRDEAESLRSLGTRGVKFVDKTGAAVAFYQVLPREEIARGPAPVRKAASPKYQSVPVYYATDRKPTGRTEAAEFFGARRNRGTQPLQYGTAVVTIPETHRLGVVETPKWYKGEFWEDPTKHVMMLQPVPMDRDAFLARLSRDSQVDGKRQVLLFVHGFNVTFYNAVRRTGQMAVDLDFPGAALTYSWPSYGDVKEYLPDETNAQWSVPHLADVLLDLQKNTEIDRIHVIAHSMGTRVLSGALVEANSRGFDLNLANVILAAPDMDADVFVDQIMPKVQASTGRLTMYASSADKALMVSQQLKRNPRLGLSGPAIVVAPGMDTIDASGLDTDLLSHSYYGDNLLVLRDLWRLIILGWEPPLRKLEAGARGEWRMGE